MRTAGRGRNALYPRRAAEGARAALAEGVGRRGGVTTIGEQAAYFILPWRGRISSHAMRTEVGGRFFHACTVRRGEAVTPPRLAFRCAACETTRPLKGRVKAT